MKRWFRHSGWIITGLIVAAGVVYAFIPQPIPVDFTVVKRGTLMVTVDDDGRTRIRERYTVDAPLGGHLARIDFDPGDSVEAGKTLLAEIKPSYATLLDPRARAEAEARVSSAEARLQQTDPDTARARASLEIAQSEVSRLQKIRETGAGTEKELEEAQLTQVARTQELKSSIFAADIARFDLQQAKAALLRTETSNAATTQPDDVFRIVSPINGRVLRVLQESAKMVAPGEALLDLGDPTNLEVVIDVLSSDAVAVKEGADVLLEQWGGNEALRGRVRRVEPAAFTKISALGVEEQRVNVLIDFVDPPAEWAALGDAYRVDARIVTWQQNDVIIVPTTALFRTDDKWEVYLNRNGEAVKQPVEIGKIAGLEAQVISGLNDGDKVVDHPSDLVKPGSRLIQR